MILYIVGMKENGEFTSYHYLTLAKLVGRIAIQIPGQANSKVI